MDPALVRPQLFGVLAILESFVAKHRGQILAQSPGPNRLIVQYVVTPVEVGLGSHSVGKHEDGGIAIYDTALQALRSSLEQAATGLAVEPELIEQISYIAGVLADGVALNWQSYGDRSRPAEQMALAESVLDTWLTERLRQAESISS